MHELGIAVQLVDLAIARAAGARVRRITVEIGVLTAVLPDALRFSFEVVSENSAVSGAQLVIQTPPAQVCCRACQRSQTLARPVGHCSCGAADFEWLTGTELRIVELEVEQCAKNAAAAS